MSDAGVSMAFAVAAVWHLGFQLTVTLVVYPALIEAGDPGSAGSGAWQRTHAAHSRRIARVVAPVYGALLLGVALAVSVDPDLWTVAGSAAVLALLAATALRAAPLHVRLGRVAATDRPALLRALQRADLVRLGLATLIALLAGVGLLTASTP